MNCKVCGDKSIEGDIYCRSCNTKLTENLENSEVDSVADTNQIGESLNIENEPIEILDMTASPKEIKKEKKKSLKITVVGTLFILTLIGLLFFVALYITEKEKNTQNSTNNIITPNEECNEDRLVTINDLEFYLDNEYYFEDKSSYIEIKSEGIILQLGIQNMGYNNYILNKDIYNSELLNDDVKILDSKELQNYDGKKVHRLDLEYNDHTVNYIIIELSETKVAALVIDSVKNFDDIDELEKIIKSIKITEKTDGNAHELEDIFTTNFYNLMN